MTNLTKRIAVAAIGIPAAVGAVYLGGWFFSGAIMLIALQALREFYHLAESKHASPNQSVGLVWAAVILLLVGFPNPDATVQTDSIFEGLGMVMIGGYVCLFMLLGSLITLAAELFRARENAMLNTALTAFGVFYIGLSMATLLLLRAIDRPFLQGAWGDSGASLVMTLFVSVWLADTAAYFVGLSFGKHKLFPRVSPKKSWEGAIGGLVGSTLAFVGMSKLLMPGVPLDMAIGCGVIVGIVGPIGDLAESLLKRDAVVKDSGGILPGHGGVFDRFDSMLFAAPAVFVICYGDKIISFLTQLLGKFGL
ncbi:MAG: phosphatidate cytidylyltransferase [Candidatus Kapabacteria bacterium]|nr:phosphatidate cytidylyltransferase [Candidatus Kapabacteria bacterium]